MAFVTHTYLGVDPKRQNVVADKLIDAGINFRYLEGSRPGIDDDVWIKITIDDSVPKSSIDAIVDQYNPDTPSPVEIEAEQDSLTMADLKQQYQNMKDGLVTIRTHMGQIKNGPNSPNAAQTGTALKLIADDIIMMTNGLDRLLDTIRIFVKTR